MNLSIQNRNESFVKNIEKLSLRRKAVYKIIAQYGFLTSHQIKDKMRLGINQVSGRITELKDMFLIIEAGTVINIKSNTHNTLWKVTNEQERIDLVNKRYTALIDEQKQLESDYHLGVSNYGLEAIKSRIKKIKKQIEALSKFAE